METNTLGQRESAAHEESSVNYYKGLKRVECWSSSLLRLDVAVPHIGALRLHYSYGGGCDLLALFSACIKREVRVKENTDGEG